MLPHFWLVFLDTSGQHACGVGKREGGFVLPCPLKQNIMNERGLSAAEMAAHLGVDPDSIPSGSSGGRPLPTSLSAFDPLSPGSGYASETTEHGHLNQNDRCMSTAAHNAKYSFSFLAGALYLPESVAVAEVMCHEREWKEVARQAAEHNLLRQRTAASRIRLLREIRYRLEQLTPEELRFLCGADGRDRRHLLFIAICQRFRFIREFVEEVLRPKALALDPQLYPADFARFIDRKAAEAPEVEKLTEKSLAKIKQVLIRMLAEAGLLDSTSSQRLTPSLPSRDLARLIAKTDAQRLRFLLLSESDIRQITS